MEKRLIWCIYGNAILLTVVAFYFFLYPAIIIIRDLNDPGLKSGDTHLVSHIAGIVPCQKNTRRGPVNASLPARPQR